MGDTTFRHIYAGNDTTSDAGALRGAARNAANNSMFAALRAPAAPTPEPQQAEAEHAGRQAPHAPLTSPAS